MPHKGQSWFKLHLIGVSFLVSWVYLLMYGKEAGVVALCGFTANVNDLLFWGSSFFLVLAFLPFALLPVRSMRFAERPLIRILAPAAMSVGGVVAMEFVGRCQAVGPAGGEAELALVVLLAIASALTGMGSGFLACRWAASYGRERTGVIMLHSMPVITVASAISVTASYLPAAALTVVVAVLPVASAFCLELRQRNGAEAAACDDGRMRADEGSQSRAARYCLPLLYVCIFVIGAVPTLLSAFSASEAEAFGAAFCMIASLAISACLAFYVFVFHRSDVILSVVAPLVLLVCVFVPDAATQNVSFLSAFTSTGLISLEGLLFILMVLAGKQSGFSVVGAYAYGRIVYVMSDICGFLAANNLVGADTDMVASVQGALVGLGSCIIFAFVGFLLMMAMRGRIAVMRAADAKTEAREEVKPSSAEKASADAAECDFKAGETRGGPTPPDGSAPLRIFSQTHGLTPREGDVLDQLLRGHTSQRIQEVLHISRGTANYHTQNIYAKCGVHSRQELIDLFESQEGNL